MKDTDLMLSVDFDTTDAQSTAQKLDQEIQSIFKSRQGQQSSTLTSLEAQMKQNLRHAQELKESLTKVGETPVATEQYNTLSKHLEGYIDEYDKLIEKSNMLEEADKLDSAEYEKVAIRMEQVEAQMDALTRRKEELEKTGQAFTDGKESEQYKKIQTELDKTNDKLKQQVIRHQEITQKEQETADKQKDISTKTKARAREVDKLRRTTDQVRKSAGKASGAMTAGFNNTTKVMRKGVRMLLKYALGISSIFVLVNKLRRAVSEGLRNLAGSGVSVYTEQLKELKASLLTLKNSFASALEPIITTIMPYLQRFVDAMTQAIDKIAQFIAAMRGQNKYIKAIKQTGDAIEKTGEQANKALGPLDNLNVITGQEDMFEETEISSDMINAASEFQKKLNDIKNTLLGVLGVLNELTVSSFIKGFNSTTGDLVEQLQKVKDSLFGIKDAVARIINNSAVKQASAALIKQVSKTLGAVTGLAASAGATLMENIFGGIEQFLNSNEGKIKNDIFTNLGISEKKMKLVEDIAGAFEKLLKPLSSDSGISITANALKIIYDCFAGIYTFVNELSLAIAKVFADPIIDNADKLQTALQGILDVIDPLVATVAGFVEKTRAEVQSLWDEHLSPLLDTISKRLSEFTGQLLDWWNEGPAPMLISWANDVKVFYEEYIEPTVSEIFGLVSQVVDVITVFVGRLFDKLKVGFDWFTTTVWPVLQPLLQTMWNVIIFGLQNIMSVLSALIKFIRYIVDVITDIVNLDFKKLWEDTKKYFKDAWDGFIKWGTNFAKGFTKVFGGIINIFKGIGTAVVNAFTTIKEKVQPIFDWIAGVLEKLKEGFEAVTHPLQTLNNIKEGAKNAASNVWNTVTGLLDKINPFKKAKGYATGQVIPPSMSEHLAILGDNKKETEVVSPLSTMQEAMMNALRESGFAGAGVQEIVLNLDGREFMRAMIRQNNEYKKQNGGVSALA